ncbi:hypothetical protein ACI77I_25945 [Pseudomonas sp. D47]|uniref:hypothetical protein n=1 Tax=Pseudomonas sp. D47 TaxID=3159447 RepID=UPI00387AE67D
MSLSWLSLLLPWLVADFFGGAELVQPHPQQIEVIAKIKADTALAHLRRDAKEAAIALAVEQARSDQLATHLAQQQRKNRRTTDRLSREIARVNDLYREALDARPKPVPACVFTAEWVRIYDEATGAAMPAVTGSVRVTAAPGKPQALGQISSGVSQSQVLEHHVRYAEQCRNTAVQLDLLIDQVKGK